MSTDKLYYGVAYYDEYMPYDRVEKDMEMIAEAIQEEDLDGTVEELVLRRFFVTELKDARKYPTGVWRTTFREFLEHDVAMQTIYFILCENEQKKYAGKLGKPEIGNKELFGALLQRTKEYWEERNKSIEQYFENRKELSFYEATKLAGLLLGSGTWENNAEELLASGKSLKDVIAFREEVYDYMKEKIGASSGEDASGLSYRIRENVRRGRYAFKGMPDDVRIILEQCEVSDWYIDRLCKIRYLVPKVHVLTMLRKMY